MKLFAIVLLAFMSGGQQQTTQPQQSQTSQAQQQQQDEQQQRQQAQARAAQELKDKLAAVPKARPGDVDTIDHLLAATYDVISGPPGEREWDRFRSLFYPGARLAAVRHPDPDNRSAVLNVFSPDDYIQRAGAYLRSNGFFERGVHNHVDRFGNIAQVFSTYESRHSASDAPFARGINSFQLFFDGQRWWVLTIYWDQESQANPIPTEFQ
jgi:hypothetical protein